MYRKSPSTKRYVRSKSRKMSSSSSSSSSSSDQELQIRRKNLPKSSSERHQHQQQQQQQQHPRRRRRPSSHSDHHSLCATAAQCAAHSKTLTMSLMTGSLDRAHPHLWPTHYAPMNVNVPCLMQPYEAQHHRCYCAAGQPVSMSSPCPPPTAPTPTLPAPIHQHQQHQQHQQLQCQPEVEERLQRLEGDKDSLQMQISILMDQIEVQTEKIGDLERNLLDKNSQLKRSEEILQTELLSRSSAETRQLELLSEMSSIKLRYAALEKENCELRSQMKRSEQDMVALVSQCYSVCGATLGSNTNRKDLVENLQLNLRNGPSGSPLRVNPNTNKALPSATSALSLHSSPSQQQGSYLQTSKTPPANMFRKVDLEPFNSLPRHTSSAMLSPTGAGAGASGHGCGSNGGGAKRAVVFGKHFQLPTLRVSSKRSNSAPNLAETEKAASAMLAEPEDVTVDSISPSSPHSPSLTSFSKQPRGLKKIFDKLKRNNSGALEGDPSSPLTSGDDFRRGGMRSTAGPRLGWNGSLLSADPSSPKPTKESELPFSQWSTDEIAGWFHDMGLQLYASDIQRWVTRGKQLLEVSPTEMEKELAIKNPLHKKKIILALEAKGRQQDPMTPITILPELLTNAGKLDHQWTVRWLDDIGLPQYKDAFLESRIDGRMLHLLTVDDLCSHLKVTNFLHLICIRRGIQVLRLNEYNAACLQRRSVPDDPAHPTPSQVAVWTNHRVMEWLRAVDLSEYAPNMRGSGVHGGLLVFESRFTAELLATLLSIPQSKTLLRRHLATHFNQLLGRDIVQAKRDMETSPTYPPLNPVSKVKILKKSQFTLKRKKGKVDEFDAEDWVCPDCDTHDFNSEKNPCHKDQNAKSTDL